MCTVLFNIVVYINSKTHSYYFYHVQYAFGKNFLRIEK